MTRRIIIVEHDEAVAAQLSRQLQRAGFEPTWLTCGRDLRCDEAVDAAAVMIDLELPDVSGLALVQRVRRHSDVPVVVLGARGDAIERASALRLGADDYLVKPISADEVVDRVRARSRRPVLQRDESIEVGPVRIDFAAHLVSVDRAPVALTLVEFRLLTILAQRCGSVVTRSMLVSAALDPDRAGTERTLDVHVSRLRRKLRVADLIQTVRGIGYRMEAEQRMPFAARMNGV